MLERRRLPHGLIAQPPSPGIECDGDTDGRDGEQPREAQTARFARLRRQEQWRYLFLLVPAVVFLIVFYGYPVAAMLLRSFSEPTWGWQNFEPLTRRAARSTSLAHRCR